MLRRLRHQFGVDQRFIALHIDDDRLVVPAALLDDFGQTIGAGRMVSTGQQHRMAVLLRGGEDVGMIGGNPDLLGPGKCRSFGDADDHRLAAQIE